MKLLDPVALILKEKGGKFWSVSPNDTVYRALELMADKNLGALLVMAGDRLEGIFSERDYARKVILKGKSSKDLPVWEVMTAPAVAVTPQTTVDECMKLMTEKRHRHLPVVDGDAVVGVISIGDLVKWVITSQEKAIRQLQDHISGNYPA